MKSPNFINFRTIAVLFSTMFVLTTFQSCQKDEELVPEVPFEVPSLGAILLDHQEYEQLPAVSIESIPNINEEGEADLRSGYVKLKTPPVRDQGQEGSCTAFAAGYVVMSALYKNKNKSSNYTDCGANRSPEFLYNNTKASSNCSSGAYVNHVLNWLKNNGIPRWCSMPYSDTNGCSTKPSSTVYKEAQNSGKVMNAWGVIPNVTFYIKMFVNKGYPLILSMNIDQNFMNQTSTSPYIYKSSGGKIYGGHAMVIVGYDDTKEAWIVQNSWGNSWADKGYCYISYSQMTKLKAQLYIAFSD